MKTTMKDMTIAEWLGEDNTLGMDIWSKKYQQNGETFMEWLDRISNGDIELKKLIVEKKFLFGGRILSNRGLHKNGRKVTYSNCYVLEAPEDNIESIFETASKLARTFSYGGGCGIDISKLSPRGAAINNTAKETTGAVSFMELYNMITGLIGQNGRRGALMLSMDCNHPDLEEFISVKNDLNTITKANISVRVDDDFMRAVLNDDIHELKYVREETGEVISKKVRAKVIFDELCHNNWDFAEPGILFWDRIKSHSLLAHDSEFEYAGVNPCAEEPLPAGGSCLLGSINLSEFVTGYGSFDYDSFRDAVRVAVIALNNVLDEGLPLHPLKEQRDSVGDWRQIGLGIFGLADMLIKMGVSYGDEKSLDICNDIGFTMINEAIKTSALLAKKDGAYPKYKKDTLVGTDILNGTPFYMSNTDKETKKLVEEYGLRNSQLLTIAPTGSISTMLGVSGGIEPIFDTHYERKTESLHDEDKYYIVYTPIVEQYMKDNDVKEVKWLPEFFKTAKTITPKKRVDMQSVWQEHIDASISSTVNLPESATVQDVINLYTYAWEAGLKGMTIFRENCARLGILTSIPDKKEEDIPSEILERGEWKSLAEDTYYVKRNLKIGCGKLKLFIGYSPMEKSIQDLYIVKSGQGGCEKNLQALAISMSALLRVGGNLEQLERAFAGITPCPSFISSRAKGLELSQGNYCGGAIINEVKRFLSEVGVESNIIIQQETMCTTSNCATCENKCFEDNRNNKCPECGEDIASSGGCVICLNCGYSKCD